MRKINCANTEGIFGIIQSIQPPKAEPFKGWFPKVGYERVQEIEDPELATRCTKEICRAKGYSENWIEKRLWGIDIRAKPARMLPVRRITWMHQRVSSGCLGERNEI